MAAEEDLALRLFQLVENLDERGFAAAARAGDSDKRPGGDFQIDIVEDWLIRLFGVGE